MRFKGRAAIYAAIAVVAVAAALLFSWISSGHRSGAEGVDDRRMIAAAGEPQNWMVRGGTLAGEYFSKLDQINAGTVARLSPAWSFDFDTTRGQEAEPLVVDGVMYVTSAWSKVFAINAATGAELWRYDPEVPGETGLKACCDVINRGAAVYKGKVYSATLDGRLIALDAKTGALLWSQQTVDPGQNYTISGAPRVIRDKVIIGNAGAEYNVRGYVSAYDAATGKLVWRFYTVPGDPAKGPDKAASDEIMARLAGPTWSGEWYRYGGGGTAWDGIAYDAELGQIIVGTGNGSPWNHRIRSDGKGDNLFLCSLIALDPDTGKYRWHYQQNPAESWDYNSSQPVILTTLKIGGADRKVILHAPKNGFFYVLDRATGKPISAKNYVPVTWASAIDMATGRPVEASNARFQDGPFLLQPGPPGAHNFSPMAFDRQTGLVYFSAAVNSVTIDSVETYEIEGGGRANTGVRASGLTARKFLIAWDPVNQREAWRQDVEGGGVLATAGGLVFQARGAVMGELVAYRATDGRPLWRHPMPNSAMPGPISYSVDGVQYIAIVTGAGGPTGFRKSPFSYASQPGRVVAFRLDGKASLPADPGPAPAFNPPKERWPSAAVARGGELFGRYCARCHSPEAQSPNIVPDLRRSTTLANGDAWQGVVHDGALKDRGMVGWSAILSREESDMIRGYVSEQARKAQAAGDRPPSRAEEFRPRATTGVEQ